ncbi:TnsA endonuclease N-terminal domain-containing protein [Undibacterium crateris]|uniref:TnsA endonuclease N-terminal domain-containing protein n=1 Tax=Undibacterium crateris TaxID=2528175 RepID=UPI001389D374|nr:TnsA endonuclease N-terminal domain-containing protein [Undibacterium crateris]NDI85464.1 hypothetical protein [Undibacterium crateris]
MPTRKITRSPVKVTGTTPDDQQFESTLEEDFLVLMRFNRLVDSERIETQSVKVDWQDDAGKMRTYTPDVLVHFRKDLTESRDLPSRLCEIKPNLDEDNKKDRPYPPRTENAAENKLKWAAASRLAAMRGWEFSIVYEREIRTPYLDNAKFLMRYLEHTPASQIDAQMLACLTQEGPISLEEFIKKFAKNLESRAKIFPNCYRLIATQQIHVDLTKRLTLQTILTSIDAGNQPPSS